MIEFQASKSTAPHGGLGDLFRPGLVELYREAGEGAALLVG